MAFRSVNLRTQLSLVFAGMIGAFAILMSLIVDRIAGRQVEEAIGFELSELAFHMGDKFDRGMWSRLGEVTVLTELDVLREPDDLPAIQRLVDRLSDAIPVFTWVGFVDPVGRVLAATDGILVGGSLAHRPVYNRGIAGPFVGDVHGAVLLEKYFPQGNGEPLRFVDISFPVRDAAGATVGVLATHLSFEWAREIEQSLIQFLKNRRNVELFIVGSDGKVRLSPLGQADQPLDAGLLQKAKDGRNGWSVERWDDGTDYVVGYAAEAGHQTYSGMDWLFFAREPLASAYAPVRHLEAVILGVGFALAAAFAVLGRFAAGRIAYPLEAIAAAADSLRAGRASQLPTETGSREIVRLSLSLRRLVDALTRIERKAGDLEELAHHDPLTGLSNRVALKIHLERLASRANPEGRVAAILGLDLDGFKPINDTLGHPAGDELLRQVATRLNACVRGRDFVARTGGDEFLIVLETTSDRWRDETAAVAARVLSAIGTAFEIQDRPVSIGCSIGAACWPVHGASIDGVIKLADTALYDAKRAGKRRAVFHDPVAHLAEA